MTELRTVTDGLMFPEGPVAMPDGSVLLVEIRRGTLTRVHPDGRKETVAEPGGGPNGAALGPDGRVYLCNNGGNEWLDEPGGLMRPVGQGRDYSGGRIEAVDLKTGAVETLYTECEGRRLKSPNDLVFDGEGGFWFTDLGKVRDWERTWDRTGIHYARADGSFITEAAFPLITPNGIGLSPDDSAVYVAETQTGRIWAFDIEAPGVLKKHPWPSPHGGRLVNQTHGYRMLDSLALDAAGNICVATLMDPGISIVRPDGSGLEHVPMPDPYTTNICFGGPDLRTAFITLSHSGRLVSCDWPEAGLPLHYLNERAG
ncbi:MAG: SMP-30/gluconolactonase/LRE family protein [Alphaproteobacteria bacterium]|nr:SMP-30/gluconolactonase/LRE family protein [Alphaproteobacteria bacterium]MCY3755228.1 SMP-30/gluconolactonase/LRE family protein [Alphaproteobacteria bacterium]